MFFFLSKTLYYLILPITWVCLCLLFAIFIKKWRKGLLILGFLLLYISANPIVSNYACLWWEHPPTPIKSLEKYEVGIVLTGMSNSSKKPKDRIYAERGIDRLLQAIRLYKEGYISKIMISGVSESVSLEGKQLGDSRTYTYTDLLKQVGVRPEDIWIEPDSKNTYENAQMSAQLLTQRNAATSKVLVISSAFHLRRALACFEEAGLKSDGFATDFYSKEANDAHLVLSMIPTEEGLTKTSRIIREVVGYMVYDMTGKL